jgi:hypothetical protein
LGLALAVSALPAAQQKTNASPPKISPQRVNELTLAKLRPGRDTKTRAVRLYKGYVADPGDDRQGTWMDLCRGEALKLEADANGKIQVLRMMTASDADPAQVRGGCSSLPATPWKTGRGLGINDPEPRVVQLYGEPDSRSPSTKDGRRLELLYYAFDWAGPDVPQVMEVVCTIEDDARPGRVVEITLAAPSL